MDTAPQLIIPALIDGATYTVDARTPDGAYGSDSGLSAQQVRNALANAPKLGVTLLAVFRDDEPVITPEQMTAAFSGKAVL